MLHQLKRLMRAALHGDSDPGGGSVAVTDPAVIEAFARDQDNPFLVSFPRTGSHWLRMLMELYFGRPSLVRVFYHPERTDYLTLHTHDLDLDVRRRNVVYLHRDPVDTVFSQLAYHGQAPDDAGRVRHWAGLYGRHLDKWLRTEDCTTHKTVLTYEGMRADLEGEFARLAAHFGQEPDPGRLEAARERVTKEEVRARTGHDQRVVRLRGDYARERAAFRATMGALVLEEVLSGRPELEPLLSRPGGAA